MTKGLRIFFISLLLFCITPKAKADINSYINELKQRISDIWHCGDSSVYVPTYVWHNRLTYDKDHIDKYNENPWGLGFGRYLYEGGDWHGLYAMAFKDSNGYAETFFGYAMLKNRPLDEKENWKLGYGYTLGLTQRHEYHYLPVPAPLPIASLSYKNFSINAAYVPGIKNEGNVLFTWLKWDF